MFGAFRASAPLSGGLLWKIPWRLSAPQKLRHRRRMRRVDNIVAILDTALKRNIQSQPVPTPDPPKQIGNATAEELSQTAEGQRLLSRSSSSSQSELRHGRGPPQCELLPSKNSADAVRTGDVARGEGTIKLIERWKAEMPAEAEMLPRDKYTMFDRKERNYRKGVHKLPKWTRVSQRLNPPGF
ncbi:54S ribosomal protein L31, mitochondrial [Teratosphaeria destructans]|uniref:54S ribosomal protein L31, mitochondrial n=1 Tax=Teratosphaeria destructans TaxID=418781 RepID=A0A9W7SPS6_9PEZI|nr:54S ribosomal protein L31, mitochondrial [Teratosphaeria destructans]